MAHIESRKHEPARQPRLSPAAATLLSLAVPGLALAQAEPSLPAVNVTATGDAPAYKADAVSSPKFTQPLVDTPQTISVIKKEVLQEQGAANLTEALRNSPGVTLQLGEGGNTSLGDSIFMRGFDTKNSIFVDNVRDLGAVTRDTFNVEQVEIVKGPAGADIGRGATSGYVNLVTKLPQADDFASGTASYGSGDRKRVTADLNRNLDLGIPGSAFRLNLMKQEGGVAGRDYVENDGWGIAPSLAFGLGTPTRAYLYFQHVEQDNRPDGGIPTIGLSGFYHAAFDTGGANAGVSPRKVDSENYYGSVDDFEKIKADMFTARVEHDFGGGTSLQNLFRYGKTKVESLLTSPATLTVTDPDPANWTVLLRRHDNFTENEIFANQTNLSTAFDTGPVRHELSAGIELMHEKRDTDDFTAGTTNGNLYDPDPHASFATLTDNGTARGETTTVAGYAFDTLKLDEQWQLSAGLRWERYDTEFTSVPAPTAESQAESQAATRLDRSGTLFSWKLGALYKPAPNGSIYAAYATAEKPPGSDDFGLNAGTPSSSGNVNINTPTLDPQEAKNIELGTKWDLLDDRLALTAALYRSENKNQLAHVDPLDSSRVVQLGKQRVQGVELGAVGQVTRAWQISAGLTTMDAEILEGTSGGNASGAGVRWTPKVAATLWTTYQLPHGFLIGGGARYVGKQKRLTDPSANADTTLMPEIPAYTVVDAMAAYRVNKNLNLQLNVYNLFDKEYIATLNNNGQRYTPGAPRSAQLTASFMF